MSLLAAACSGGGSEAEDALAEMEPASVSGEEDARRWADASAPKAFATAYLPMSAAEANRQIGEEDCPALIEEGSTMTYEGGCTDSDGHQWFGRAISTGSMLSGELTITYEGFGFESEEECGGEMVLTETLWDGVVRVSAGSGGARMDMDIDVVGEGTDLNAECTPAEATVAVAYSLSMEEGADTDGDGEPDEEIWNGGGRIGNSLYGFVEASTEDEVIDDTVCETEAASGTTTVQAGDDVMVVTYDGASDCDMDSTVTWTLNGEDQGELTGVDCAAAGGRTALGGWIVLALAFSSALTRRRRGGGSRRGRPRGCARAGAHQRRAARRRSRAR